MRNNKNLNDRPNIFSAKGRFPLRVIIASDGHIPDAYDGSYFAGKSGQRAVDELDELTRTAPHITTEEIQTPEGRLKALGPLPEGIGEQPDY